MIFLLPALNFLVGCIFVAPRAFRLKQASSRSPAFGQVNENCSLLPSAEESSGLSSDSDMGWEVLDVNLLPETQGLNPFLRWAILASSVMYMASVAWTLTNLASLGGELWPLVALLTAISSTLAIIGIASTTANVTTKFEGVIAERMKLIQKETLQYLSVYFAIACFEALSKLLFDGEYILPYMVQVAAAVGLTLLLLTADSSIVVARLQRKPVNGVVPSPEEDASLLSRLTFSWLTPMMQFGYRTTIAPEDIWNVPSSEQSASCMQDYRRILRTLQDTKSSLAYILWLIHRRTLLLQFALVFTETLLYFSGAFFINRILETTPVSGIPETIAFVYVAAMFGFSIVRSVVAGANSYLVIKIETRIRNLLSSLIYEKSLRRDIAQPTGEDNKNASSGKIVNLMSVDASTVAEWAGYSYTPISTSIQILISVAYLIWMLGWSAVPGIVVLVLLIFSGGPLASKVNAGYAAYRKAADKRVHAFNEMLSGIKVIKFLAWETEFRTKIDQLREDELNEKWKNKVTEVLSRVLWFSAPFVTTLVTLGSYTALAGKDLTSTTAFTALALFNLLKGPLEQFPETVVQLLDARISLQRIDKFLDEPEILKASSSPNGNRHPVLGFSESARFTWTTKAFEKSGEAEGAIKNWRNFWGLLGCVITNVSNERTPLLQKKVAEEDENVELPSEDDQEPAVKDLNVDFPIGKLTSILGPTASGKSTLILSLLGETRKTQGQVHFPATLSTSYVPQTPWLQNATIRENILFGSPLDHEFYKKVIRACALDRDLEVLEDGDLTEVGERGVNLSGGQRQRIALARACYAKADIVILDDPLSAVDAPTAKFLMEECILGLLAKSTRILVTHAAHVAIPRSDQLVIMTSGRILTSGPVEQVFSNISSLDSPISAGSIESISVSESFLSDLRRSLPTLRVERSKYLSSSSSPSFVHQRVPICSKGVLATHKPKALVEDEETQAGKAIDPSVPMMYLNAMGGWSFALTIVLAYSLNHSATLSLDYVVYLWCKAYEDATRMQDFGRHVKPMALYAILLVLCLTLIVFRLLYLVHGMIVAGRTIHRGMMAKLMGAPLRFFEITPAGRIVNRFTKDISAVDGAVGGVAGNLVYNLVMVLFVLGFVSTVIPALLLVMIPLGFVYYRIGRYFIRTSLSVKRIASVTRSPIYSHFSESLSGRTVIRAFSASARFQDSCLTLLDAHTRPALLNSVTFTWLSLRVQSLSAIVVLFIGLFVLGAGLGKDLTGLCLGVAGISFTQSLYNLVWAGSILEVNMNSVERCNTYLTLPQEEETDFVSTSIPSNWPSRGDVTFQNVRLHYAQDQLEVLKNVSFHIEGREKVAIVGRTGAGKSSLMMALMRMVNISGGRVMIDGLDLVGLSGEELRRRITMVTQEAVVFEGSVRSNLDPSQTLPDADLWEALKRSYLVPGDANTDTNFTLDTILLEGGSNLSMGQKQLLCLARALVRKSRIIVMDEATASVDTETDSRIQETIRREFSDCTVITIAHRINTVMDYDRVIVIDGGVVVENESPLKLLDSRSGPGVFRRMCEETGELERLRAIAEAHQHGI